MSAQVSRGKHSRSSSGAPVDVSTVTWKLNFPNDIVPLVEYFGAPTEDGKAQLGLLRLAELIQVSWQSGRLTECDSSKFLFDKFYDYFPHLGGITAALKPFSSDRVIEIICQGLRR